MSTSNGHCRWVARDGHDYWNRWLKRGKREPHQAVRAFTEACGRELGLKMLGVSSMVSTIGLAMWVDGACRTLVAKTDAFFAAMAATSISEHAYEDVRLPWPAFAVAIPEGMLVAEDGVDYRLALVSRLRLAFSTRDDAFLIEGEDAREDFEWRDVGTIALYAEDEDYPVLESFSSIDRLLFEDLPRQETYPTDLAVTMTARDDRIIQCARRAIVGMLYTMQHSSSWSDAAKGKRPLSSDPRFGPPDHRCMVVGTPISIDVRKAIREYVSEGECAPSFQTLVRGHHKRQVVGVGRGGRKIIWVEPYWRGDPLAPILVRPYEVG